MGANFCPQCGAAASGGSYCAHCGKAFIVGAAPAGSFSSASTPHATSDSLPPLALSPPPASAAASNRPITQGLALAALLLNILIWPGLGSLIAGEKVGWAQGFLFLAGVILAIVLIGIPLMIGAWVWGIVTGAQLLQESS